MKKLWLTYAWKDNEDLDVDFIIQELKRAGLDVRYDRRQLLAGRSLWEQIDQQISNASNSDAWAFVVSKQSLSSPPCREELNYAVRRALDSRGPAYPLIGIFVEEIDRELLPSAIATRLYVNTENAEWVERVRSGVDGTLPLIPDAAIEPFVITVHQTEGQFPLVVEARPRTGLWNPCAAWVPVAEEGLLGGVVIRPANKVPRLTAMMLVSGRSRDGLWHYAGPSDSQSASPTHSMYALLTAKPSVLRVGPMDQPIELRWDS